MIRRPAAIAAAILFAAPAFGMDLCGRAARITCVVDGDTVWFGGEKIRIAGIDAPELRGACAEERALARIATDRLAALLSTGPVGIVRTGRDRLGRTLARLTVGDADIGAAMIAARLARPWQPGHGGWCAR
jgi:endonuclease YncB( thermonuclease family)